MGKDKRQLVAPPAGYVPPVPPPLVSDKRDVPIFRQCPVCYGGKGGVGNVYCTQGQTRYYKCDRCAHTWTAVVKMAAVKIESRTVDISTRKEA